VWHKFAFRKKTRRHDDRQVTHARRTKRISENITTLICPEDRRDAMDHIQWKLGATHLRFPEHGSGWRLKQSCDCVGPNRPKGKGGCRKCWLYFRFCVKHVLRVTFDTVLPALSVQDLRLKTYFCTAATNVLARKISTYNRLPVCMLFTKVYYLFLESLNNYLTITNINMHTLRKLIEPQTLYKWQILH
jgi:hypothetical protein